MKKYFYTLILVTLCQIHLPAQENIDVRSYTAVIHFNLADNTIGADAGLRIANTTGRSLSDLKLKLRDLTVSYARQNDNAITFSQSGEDLTLNLLSPLSAGNETSVRIVYSGSPTYEPAPSSWGGFFFGNPTFTLGVSFNTPYVSMTRHWLPSNDIPSDKATFDLTYIIPNDYAAAGTGILQSITPVGSDSVAYRWIENHPTATYLVTLAIGTYARVIDSWNGIPMEYFVMKQDSLRAVSFFSTVARMMDCFTNVYGPYPFDKVGYCLTPIGAMEHQTMISYPQSLFNVYPNAEGVAAHELSHQWWGDWVTPKDFREAWLSEGFATYSEAIYAEYLQPNRGYWSSIKKNISDYVNNIARTEGIFPLYDFPRNPPSSNYPNTIYKKGSSVLAMLRYVVGDSAFFKGLRKYGQQYAYGNATTDDFRAAIESEYNNDLQWFFDEWVMKAGFPEYTIQTIVDASSNPTRVRIMQNQNAQLFPLFKMPVEIDVITLNNDTLHMPTVTNQAVKIEEFSFPSVPANTVKKVVFDPKGVILKKVTYQTVNVKNRYLGEPSFELKQNYPNPITNGSTAGKTEIGFTLRKPSHARLEIFDSLGRKIKTLVEEELPAGEYHAEFDASALSAGTYFYHLSSGKQTAVRKMVVTK